MGRGAGRVWPGLHRRAAGVRWLNLKSFIFNVGTLVRGVHTVTPMTMRIFAITRPGLLALALAVGTLWSCVGLEMASVRQSSRDTAESLRTLAELRRLTEKPETATPARAPEPAFRPERVSISS